MRERDERERRETRDERDCHRERERPLGGGDLSLSLDLSRASSLRPFASCLCADDLRTSRPPEHRIQRQPAASSPARTWPCLRPDATTGCPLTCWGAPPRPRGRPGGSGISAKSHFQNGLRYMVLQANAGYGARSCGDGNTWETVTITVTGKASRYGSQYHTGRLRQIWKVS